MNQPVNLVPVPFRRRLLVRRRLRLWIVVWILAGFATGTTALAKYVWLLRQRQMLTQFQAGSAPLRKIDADAQRLQQQLDALGSRESLLAALERIDQPAQLIGIVGRAACGDELDIHIGEFRLVPVTVQRTREITDENGETKAVTESVDWKQLVLNGLGVDDLAVARFVSDLRATQAFDSVKLKSSSDVPGDTVGARRFEVECEYQL